MKYLLLAFALLSSNVYAEQIDAANGTFNTSETGTGAICKDILFIKRNIGNLVTGILPAQLKLYMGTHIADNPTPTSGKATDAITVSYTLTPKSGFSGIYNLCVTPTNFSWKINDTYEFRFLLNKSTADNGSFILRLLN